MVAATIGATTPTAVIIATVEDPWAVRTTTQTRKPTIISPDSVAGSEFSMVPAIPVCLRTWPNAPPAQVINTMTPASAIALWIDLETVSLLVPGLLAKRKIEKAAAMVRAISLLPRNCMIGKIVFIQFG